MNRLKREAAPAMMATDSADKPDMAGLQIEAFLSWLAVQKGASDATQKAYGADLTQLAVFLREQGADLARPGEVSRKHIQAFLAWLFRRGEAKSSMARKLAAMRSFFRFLLRSGRVSENIIRARSMWMKPLPCWIRPKPRRPPRPTPRACSAGIWPWPNCSMARACVFPKH